MNSNSSFGCMGWQTLRPVDTSRHQHYHCRHQQRIMASSTSLAKQPALTANRMALKNLSLCIFLSKHCIECIPISVRRSQQAAATMHIFVYAWLGLGFGPFNGSPISRIICATRCDAIRYGPSIDGTAHGMSGGHQMMFKRHDVCIFHSTVYTHKARILQHDSNVLLSSRVLLY